MQCKYVLSALFAAAAAVAAVPTGAAFAASGHVAVFETEVQPLTTYESPSGCEKLPPAAHVLTNETDRPVRIYADPFCVTPGLEVQPGHGSHVAPGSGSFSA
ncbi:hypothetical protein IQ251_04410 [Saccharopolyspora sp. HNM0983]|uniref:Secreted protein n=1 Tax=Saccharopolyspora montiporae TaxID=2781240 RepID=A0A929FYT8_9PSEU|nr:hypothetical protein [Saccharopolyspora sp. HNM0983]MBE9373689.1 hypothetical protein [Saccharopolyspora sp. HNM0983]